MNESERALLRDERFIFMLIDRPKFAREDLTQLIGGGAVLGAVGSVDTPTHIGQRPTFDSMPTRVVGAPNLKG